MSWIYLFLFTAYNCFTLNLQFYTVEYAINANTAQAAQPEIRFVDLDKTGLDNLRLSDNIPQGF